MRHYTNKQIREFIACPQFGDLEYGKWGALTLKQRETIYELLQENEDMEHYIKTQNFVLDKQNTKILRLYRRMKMLRVTTKTKKEGTINCAIKTQKANMSEAVGTIKAIRDYILENETGVMPKKDINKIIIDVLEGKDERN